MTPPLTGWPALGIRPQYATNAYRYVPPLMFQPGVGTYSNAITASLAPPPAGAAIFYSLDGTNWSITRAHSRSTG